MLHSTPKKTDNMILSQGGRGSQVVIMIEISRDKYVKYICYVFGVIKVVRVVRVVKWSKWSGWSEWSSSRGGHGSWGSQVVGWSRNTKW